MAAHLASLSVGHNDEIRKKTQLKTTVLLHRKSANIAESDQNKPFSNNKNCESFEERVSDDGLDTVPCAKGDIQNDFKTSYLHTSDPGLSNDRDSVVHESEGESNAVTGNIKGTMLSGEHRVNAEFHPVSFANFSAEKDASVFSQHQSAVSDDVDTGETVSTAFEGAFKGITISDDQLTSGGSDSLSSAPAKDFEIAKVPAKVPRSDIPQDNDQDGAHDSPADAKRELDSYQPFTAYVSQTCKHPSLKSHPDKLVETACLSSVPAPIVTNKLCLPSKTLLEGLLTDAQLEVCLRASAQHELRLPDGRRRGFFIGDGAGVGKGRQQAGIIFENFLRGRRKAVWLSISADLIEDARRDTADIGGKDIKFYDLRDFKNDASLARVGDGVLFCSYSLLVSKDRKAQVVEFCGKSFEGILTLDEMHRAKNLGLEENEFDGGPKAGSKTALAVQWLQENLPLARVVYVSATGTTEPEHLACLSRLGLWGAGTAFEARDGFIQQVKQSGHGAMELVCMHMKAEGQYVSRSLSFEDASFEIVKEELTKAFIKMYDAAADLWCDVISQVNLLPMKKGRGPLMWGAHQRFFAQLCISAKLNPTIEVTKAALKEGKCVVIGLQNTGESVASGEDNVASDDEVSSTVNGIMRGFLYNHCEDMDALTRQEFLERLDDIGLPNNPLDELIHKLGGPSMVAEMTGRKKRYINVKGRWQYVSRTKEDSEGADDDSADSINIRERKKFQNGDKLVAIISQAASTGISLQADRRVKNQRRRVHITLQLPWSAEKAVQQLGRSHRSNQASAPEFKLMVSPIGGEWRFASAVANRLQSLGALTQGDRRAATGSSSLLPFSIDPKYGLNAVNYLQTFIFRGAEPYPIPKKIFKPYGSQQDFCAAASSAMTSLSLDPKSKCPGDKLKRFLNRLLGLPIQLQNDLFEIFSSFMEQDIEAAKAQNTFAEGVSDIAGVSYITSESELYQSSSGAVTKYLAISTDRGVSWDQALQMHNEQSDIHTGFYASKVNRNHVVLIRKALAFSEYSSFRRFHLVLPNTGYASFTIQMDTLRDLFHKVTLTPEKVDNMKSRWEACWLSSQDMCGHANQLIKNSGDCSGPFCTEDRRRITHHVLTGLVFPFWKDVETLLGGSKDFQAVNVVRVQVANGRRVVGLLIPEICVEAVKKIISTRAGNVIGLDSKGLKAKSPAVSAKKSDLVPAALRGLVESGIWEYTPAAEKTLLTKAKTATRSKAPVSKVAASNPALVRQSAKAPSNAIAPRVAKVVQDSMTAQASKVQINSKGQKGTIVQQVAKALKVIQAQEDSEAQNDEAGMATNKPAQRYTLRARAAAPRNLKV